MIWRRYACGDTKRAIAVRIAEPEEGMPGVLIAHVSGTLQEAAGVVVVRPFFDRKVVLDPQLSLGGARDFDPEQAGAELVTGRFSIHGDVFDPGVAVQICGP